MTSRQTKALQLLSRFSISPNQLGYCGLATAPQAFKSCILEGKCESVQHEVTQFIVLNPYLDTIAQITGRDKFSYEVIESYWIGNDLLKMATNAHYELLLNNFAKQGVPPNLVEEFSKKPPTKFIPHHLFQVLHIGVGKSSGSVPYNEQTINNCMPRWGRVTQMHKKEMTVELHSLTKLEDRVQRNIKSETFEFDNKFVGEPKINDIVAVHWNLVTKILTKKEAKQLDYWTEEIVSSVRL